MKINLESEEKSVVRACLALGEVPTHESVKRIDGLKEQLMAVKKSADALGELSNEAAELKRRAQAASVSELHLLQACVDIVTAVGQAERIPEAALQPGALIIYRAEIASAVSKLGKGGEWLSEQAAAFAERVAAAGELQQKLARESKSAEMKAGAEVHRLRELVSAAISYVHGHAEPGSRAHAHLKRKYKPRTSKAPADENRQSSEPQVTPPKAA